MRRSIVTLGIVTVLTLPWVITWLTGPPLPTGIVVLVSGVGILGAAFLLAWAAETAEKDVPRAFAIAVLAVLAVAPEYAVDALYAWNAGQYVGTERGAEAANLAVANMTGANRILIGIGWAGIALYTIYRWTADADPSVRQRDGFLTDAVAVDRDLSLEIVFLLLATMWAFLVPLNGGIDALDMLVLVGLYVAYIAIVLRGDVDPHIARAGVPAYLQSFVKPVRIVTVVALFVYSGFVIFVAVEPFAHGLEALGTAAGIPPFFIIQWIAPLASDSPELIVVAYLVSKTRSTAGFNALISSKLNQWTLLIGTLVVVYSIALGTYGTLPFDQKQAGEIWLTAAQSFFAISILLDFEISVREAVILLVLFCSQVLIEFTIVRGLAELPFSSYEFLLVYSAIYLVLGTVYFALQHGEFRLLIRRTGQIGRAALSD